MALPFFYSENVSYTDDFITLDEENSKHIVQVLRMAIDEQINITNGKGIICRAEITDANKKKCTVKVLDYRQHERPSHKVMVAVSPVKNAARLEWFLEKATEMGVGEIVPLLCKRTEKYFFKKERMHGILISAMLQSQQAWLPVLSEPTKFETFLKQKNSGNKFIAHCEDQHKTSLPEFLSQNPRPLNSEYTIVIGPEGDFTKDEIDIAIQQNFVPVSLGNTRLRTETAALVASVLLCVS